VQKAIDFEVKRQAEVLGAGRSVAQETRNFDAVKNVTIPLRSKEEAHDYRYFPEPDLQPILVEEEQIEEVRSRMPRLPWERVSAYTKEHGLSAYDAGVLTEDKQMSDFFEKVLSEFNKPKTVANLLNTQVRSFLNQKGIGLDAYLPSPEALSRLLRLVEDGKVSHSAAMQRILPLMEEGDERSPSEIATAEDLLQESDDQSLLTWVEEALAAYPDKVDEYRKGKKGVLGLFMGEVMRRSQGKADPKRTNQLIREKLGQ
jgi:aspartyl-tRNA(Asn)/glutamyl-tRNA(Gln) amidotransferase subunit B